MVKTGHGAVKQEEVARVDALLSQEFLKGMSKINEQFPLTDQGLPYQEIYGVLTRTPPKIDDQTTITVSTNLRGGLIQVVTGGVVVTPDIEEYSQMPIPEDLRNTDIALVDCAAWFKINGSDFSDLPQLEGDKRYIFNFQIDHAGNYISMLSSPAPLVNISRPRLGKQYCKGVYSHSPGHRFSRRPSTG